MDHAGSGRCRPDDSCDAAVEYSADLYRCRRRLAPAPEGLTAGLVLEGNALCSKLLADAVGLGPVPGAPRFEPPGNQGFDLLVCRGTSDALADIAGALLKPHCRIALCNSEHRSELHQLRADRRSTCKVVRGARGIDLARHPLQHGERLRSIEIVVHHFGEPRGIRTWL